MPWTGVKHQIKIQFQDVLALSIIVPFLIFTALVLFTNKEIEILRIYQPIIITILAGYFGQGAVKEFRGGSEIDEHYRKKPYI